MITSTTIVTTLIKEAKRQGFIFLLLVVAVVYFENGQKTTKSELKKEIAETQSKVDLCNDQLLKYYKDDHLELVSALKENSSALEATNLLITKLVKE